MGFRMHVCSKLEKEFGSGHFNWCTSELAKFFENNLSDDTYIGEDYWEINKFSLESLINRMRCSDVENKSMKEAFDCDINYSVKETADIFELYLKEAKGIKDDYLTFVWF